MRHLPAPGEFLFFAMFFLTAGSAGFILFLLVSYFLKG
jgi:hypothetical protein